MYFYLLTTDMGSPLGLYPTIEDALLARERFYYSSCKVKEMRVREDYLDCRNYT